MSTGERGGVFDLAEALFFNKQYERARELCMEGARKNDHRCERLLGWIYLRGHGCPVDREFALQWFSKAAAADAEAVFGIGVVHYERGEYSQAGQHFESARHLGYVPATRWLGVLHHLGLGVEQNVEAAERLYLEAASSGNLPAYLQHCLMLLHGRHGFLGRMKAIPRLAYFLFESFRVALRDKHSQRLQ